MCVGYGSASVHTIRSSPVCGLPCGNVNSTAQKEIEKQCSNNGQQRTAEVAHRFCNSFALHQRFDLGKDLVCTGIIILIARVGISVIGNRTCAGIGDDFVRLSIAVEINLIQAAVNDEDRTVVMRPKTSSK